MFQHIVRLQTAGRRKRHALHVAAGAFQIRVLAMSDQQSRLRVVQFVQHREQRFGLVCLECPRIHNRQLLLRELRRERRAQRAQQHLLRQRVTVIARLWSVDSAAMAPKRRANRADARAAGALLLPELAARAADFALVLGLVRARTQPAQIPPRSFVQQVLVDFRAKDRVRQLHLTDLLAIQIDYVDDRHNLFSLFLETRPGSTGTPLLLRFSCLADKNICSARPWHRTPHQQQVFVGVHFHYFQILRRHSLVAHVARKMLIFPDARGERTAADAARRAVMHRAVRRIAAAVVPALHAALKTLALAHAAYVDELAGLETLHQHAIADFRLVLRFLEAHFLQHLHRRDAGLLEVPGHGLVHAARLHEFHEAELRGFVAIRLLGPALHNNARPCLKHGAPDQRAVVGEHLRHPQLDSDNPVNRHFPLLSFAACPPLADIGCVLLLRVSLYFLREYSVASLPYLAACPKALISTSTPGGRSSFISASTVSGVGSRMSISRLCVRISNCSRDFLSTCGDRKTVQRLMVVGRGIGPATSAPVRFAVSTISRVDWSRIL